MFPCFACVSLHELGEPVRNLGAEWIGLLCFPLRRHAQGNIF